MAHQVIEQTEDGPRLLREFQTREEAQAFCDLLVAQDYRYKDVLTILSEPGSPSGTAAAVIESVYAEAGADPAELAAVREVFQRAGFEVDIEPVVIRRSAQVLPWIVQVTLTVPIAAWFTALAVRSGTRTADDVHDAMKAFVKGVFAARREVGTARGAMDIDDPDGSHVVLSSGLPDEALDALADIDWDEARGSYLTWDGPNRTWRLQ